MTTGYAYRRLLERSEEFGGGGRRFPGAKLNTCWNAVDRHVGAGKGERVALIWDSPGHRPDTAVHLP